MLLLKRNVKNNLKQNCTQNLPRALCCLALHPETWQGWSQTAWVDGEKEGGVGGRTDEWVAGFWPVH